MRRKEKSKEKRFDLRNIPPGMMVRSTIKKGVDYLKSSSRETPFLLMDRDKVVQKAKSIGKNIRGAEGFYAVKANPHPDVLDLINKMGLGFEVASEGELRTLLDLGVSPNRIISSNPIKTSLFLQEAARAGLRYFAFDTRDEVDKMASCFSNSNVYVRLSVSNEGSQWPLSKKFGVELEEALDLLLYAASSGLSPAGATFHVGSQCANPYNWDAALDKAGRLWEMATKAGLRLELLNIGGGYPIHYTKDVVEIETIERRIDRRIRSIFPPETRILLEPGRAVVGDAGLFVTSVIGKANRISENWMYLDVGVFNGLMESVGGIRYSYLSESTGPLRKWTIAGPSCDSFDVIDHEVELPEPEVGDHLIILGCGAYTTCYASEFNGFSIPETILI